MRAHDQNRALRRVIDVFGTAIDAVTWDEALNRVIDWAGTRQSRMVCICNAHSVVTSALDPDFANVLNDSDMATPDGAPVAWFLRRHGAIGQPRVNGPDLMLMYLRQAERVGQVVSFFGGSEVTLELLVGKLRELFPRLRIGVAISPPFRELSSDENNRFAMEINDAGTAVLFVGLGCPKQEQWMHQQRGKVQAVMMGVGAAFDYHAGTLRRAPQWMRDSGLEWLHRLGSEPRRLWRRYLVTNTLFVLFAGRQILGKFFFRGS